MEHERSRRILVLLDTIAVRQEVIRYAVALARRMDAEVTLLLLIPLRADPEQDEGAAVARGRRVMARQAEKMAAAGVSATWEVIEGEPRSELLKFMALHPSFLALVWGGDPAVIRPGAARRIAHWLPEVRGDLNCPLVVPTPR